MNSEQRSGQENKIWIRSEDTKFSSAAINAPTIPASHILPEELTMPYVEFAPLRIPFHRRLETAAVALYYYSFYFGALLGTVIILGLFFTSYYPIAIIYLTWAYLIDGRTPDHGGRRSEFVRKARVWKYFRDYFPIKLIKTTELDPSKNYVFGYHPHGVLCAGAFCNFATEATDFSNTFPGIIPHLLPLMGEWITKKSLLSSLEKSLSRDRALKYHTNGFALILAWLT